MVTSNSSHMPKLQVVHLTVYNYIFTFHTIWSQPVTCFTQCMQSHLHCATASSTFLSIQSQSAVTSFIPCSQPVTCFTQCGLGHQHNSVKTIHLFHTLQSQLLSQHLFHIQQSQSLVSHAAVTVTCFTHCSHSYLICTCCTQCSHSYTFNTAVLAIYHHIYISQRRYNKLQVLQCSYSHFTPHLFHTMQPQPLNSTPVSHNAATAT